MLSRSVCTIGYRYSNTFYTPAQFRVIHLWCGVSASRANCLVFTIAIYYLLLLLRFVPIRQVQQQLGIQRDASCAL